ncbi:MAG: hypothetical protein IK038_05150 [Bacteroidaceae bacterium]|nr:hypothetical protein [Bacteroidaceae bacterium]
MSDELFLDFVAIAKMGCELGNADGVATENEADVILKLLRRIKDITDDEIERIINATEEMDVNTAMYRIASFDDESKQMVSDFFAEIIIQDDLNDEEKELFKAIVDYAHLPIPQMCKDSDEDKKEADEDAKEDDYSYFLVVKSSGLTHAIKSDIAEWKIMETALASCIGASRVEIVRYTKPLNAISKKLNLNGRHLVFMVDRNGNHNSNLEDNMPATLLYGAGYPIYGDMLFALETDDDYTIEGFFTYDLLKEAFDYIDEAVGGLLRIE